ncbi:hypothetical protein L9F63_007156, partial [Diploptera punctata]
FTSGVFNFMLYILCFTFTVSAFICFICGLYGVSVHFLYILSELILLPSILGLNVFIYFGIPFCNSFSMLSCVLNTSSFTFIIFFNFARISVFPFLLIYRWTNISQITKFRNC